MIWLVGLTIFLGSAAMTAVARPRDGVPIRLVETWEFGWIYALAATFGLVGGVALIISDWPLR